MQLYIEFPDFSNTAAIDKYIEKRLRKIHRRLEKSHQGSLITLRGSVLHRKPDGSPKNFEAELIVRLPGFKKPFVIKKKNKNFRTALSETANAMESALIRETEKLQRGRTTFGKTLYPIRAIKRQGGLPKRGKKKRRTKRS